MSNTKAKWLYIDSNTLKDNRDTTDELEVKLVSAGSPGGGALESTVDGINVRDLGITNDMLEGNIAFTKLADYTNIARLDENETVAGDWVFTNSPTTSTTNFTDTQLVTKQYVDGIAQGLDPKDSVIGLIDTDVTLSGLPNPSPLHDGITYSDGDRILLIGQSDDTENGIWIVNESGAWTRPDDFDTGDGCASNFVFVEQGTTYADTGWVCTTDSPNDVIDTNSNNWTQFSSAGVTQAGVALGKSGTTLNVLFDNSTIGVNGSNQLYVLDNGINENKIISSAIGNGLTGGSGTAISVLAEDTTIAVSASGIKVAANSLDSTHMKTTTVGNGLTGGNGTPFTVVAKTDGGIGVDAGGVFVNYDDITIGMIGSPAKLGVKDDSIDTNHIKADAVTSSELDTTDSYDFTGAGDILVSDTPATGQSAVNQNYVDQAVATANSRQVYTYQLTAGDIANKYITLPTEPAASNRVVATPEGAGKQIYGIDYIMTGASPNVVLSWSGLGWDQPSQLKAGEYIVVEYDI